MNEITKTSTFDETIPGHQLAWDSTSLGCLKYCPRHYQYRVIEGYIPRGQSGHLTFGLLFHGALERYDHAKAEGKSHADAIKVAVYYAMEKTWDENLQRPWTSNIPEKNRDTLLRTIIWYLLKFENDPAETLILTNNKPAVELSFRFETGIYSNLNNKPYLLCGHLDRAVNFLGGKYTLDRKTTKYNLDENYGSKYSPDNQISLYSIAGTLILNEPMRGIIIDAAQVGVSFTRFHRYEITRTKASLEEWFNDFQIWMKMAESFANNNYWPMNDKACLTYWSHNDPKYSGCPYREVCSLTPSLRKAHLEAMFDKSPWDPLITRGDI